MCGLVALVGTDGLVPDPRTLQGMLGAIKHRGPDDDGIHLNGPVALGFRRLSILDLSPAGHQPMQAADGKVTIVFNGEIYNYLEVRKELQALGHEFHSQGDTEVLLKAYLEWGRDCVSRLNGMWAFLIDDTRNGLLFGSRDRFGIKPLYKLRTKAQMAFASEIKAFRAVGLTAGRPDLRTVANFLLECRLDRDTSTFYDDIEAIPAAHSFELDRQGRFRQWRYWDLEQGSAPAQGNPAEAFAALFEDAVRLHMRSDVPVSVHLSGGLDSTAIACSSARIRRLAGAAGPLTTFSYSDAQFDETPYIAATIAQTGADLTTLRASPRQLWDLLPEVLRAQDEPFHSLTPVVGYLLMKMTAASGVKVVLNGQGADETLGGYPSFFRNYWHTLLTSARPAFLLQEVRAWAAVHQRSAAAELAQVALTAFRSLVRRMASYREVSDRRWLETTARNTWIAPEVLRHGTPPAFSQESLKPALRWATAVTPLPLFLRVEDRNSSAHSVEARVPFLDHRLVEFALGAAPEWNLRGPLNKFVLRESMASRIPELVRCRPDKMGFPTAGEQWLRQDLYEPAREIVTDAGFRDFDLLDGRRVAHLLESHRRGESDQFQTVLRAVQLYLWTKMHKKAPAALPDPPRTVALHC